MTLPSPLDPGQCSAAQLVDHFALQPHPEGGWYRECHRSAVSLLRADGEPRPALTQILFLLGAGGISRWHRVLGADEAWHFVAGDPLDLWLLPPGGGSALAHRLGPVTLPEPSSWPAHAATPVPVVVVPADWWQAARCPGRWTLVSCCVGPGFDFRDFELLYELPAADHPPGAIASLL